MGDLDQFVWVVFGAFSEDPVAGSVDQRADEEDGCEKLEDQAGGDAGQPQQADPHEPGGENTGDWSLERIQVSGV